MQAVILAAGMGQRLGALTDECPKAMVRVAGRELILRVKDLLDAAGIDKRIIVSGYKADILNKFLKREWPGAITVQNTHYSKGSILSIETAIPFIGDDFIIMNTDHIYPKRIIQKLTGASDGITAMCDFDRPLHNDDMKVKLGKDGRLEQIRKTLTHYDGGYIGITFCGHGSLANYKAALTETKKQESDSASVEFILGHLAKNIEPVNICDTSGVRWLEVDTLEDLFTAEKTIGENREFLL